MSVIVDALPDRLRRRVVDQSADCTASCMGWGWLDEAETIIALPSDTAHAHGNPSAALQLRSRQLSDANGAFQGSETGIRQRLWSTAAAECTVLPEAMTTWPSFHADPGQCAAAPERRTSAKPHMSVQTPCAAPAPP